MGILDRFRKSRNADVHQDWKVIQTEEELLAALEQSKTRPVGLFKHSVSCGISAMAKHQLEQDWDFTDQDLTFYYIDLINFRPVSNKVTSLLSVIHQSPQVILVKNGKAVFNTSHHSISVSALHKALNAN